VKAMPWCVKIIQITAAKHWHIDMFAIIAIAITNKTILYSIATETQRDGY
jgi:hypothetical protein